MTAAWASVLQSVAWSLAVVAVGFGLAWVLGAATGPIPRGRRSSLQVVGAGLTFWAVYAKVGWSIQTFDGSSPPEMFNQWFFRVVTGLGMLCLAYATLVRSKGEREANS